MKHKAQNNTIRKGCREKHLNRVEEMVCPTLELKTMRDAPV